MGTGVAERTPEQEERTPEEEALFRARGGPWTVVVLSGKDNMIPHRAVGPFRGWEEADGFGRNHYRYYIVVPTVVPAGAVIPLDPDPVRLPAPPTPAG